MPKTKTKNKLDDLKKSIKQEYLDYLQHINLNMESIKLLPELSKRFMINRIKMLPIEHKSTILSEYNSKNKTSLKLLIDVDMQTYELIIELKEEN